MNGVENAFFACISFDNQLLFLSQLINKIFANTIQFTKRTKKPRMFQRIYFSSPKNNPLLRSPILKFLHCKRPVHQLLFFDGIKVLLLSQEPYSAIGLKRKVVNSK